MIYMYTFVCTIMLNNHIYNTYTAICSKSDLIKSSSQSFIKCNGYRSPEKYCRLPLHKLNCLICYISKTCDPDVTTGVLIVYYNRIYGNYHYI